MLPVFLKFDKHTAYNQIDEHATLFQISQKCLTRAVAESRKSANILKFVKVSVFVKLRLSCSLFKV